VQRVKYSFFIPYRLQAGGKIRKPVEAAGSESEAEEFDLRGSNEDEDGDFEYDGPLEKESDFRTENSHSSLIHSLENVVKTKR
jgi:hypothetical protein